MIYKECIDCNQSKKNGKYCKNCKQATGIAYHQVIKDYVRLSDSVKTRLSAGDITLNHLLAFFSLIMAPLLLIISELSNVLRFGFWETSFLIISTTMLAFLLILRTSRGQKLIIWIVNYIKKVDIS